MITLYDFELSGNCYKVRLMLGFLGLAHEIVPVDFYPGADHRSDWFREINPLGELPVLTDDGQVICDSHAILVWLVSRYDAGGHWYPSDPARQAAIIRWFDIAGRLTATSSLARLITAMFYEGDLARARAGAHRILRMMDEHLWFAEAEGQHWLVPGDRPTLADIACFPYVALSEEGGISRQDYPAVRRWLDRVRRIEGFQVMSGIFPAAAAHPAGELAWETC